jgi:hypothetical protein
VCAAELVDARSRSSSGSDDSAFSPAEFDRYLNEHGIPEEHYPAALALQLAESPAGGCRPSRRAN